MSGKRGGKKKSAAVEEDARVEAEAQALIQEQIDTTDVDGAFLRGLLVNLADEEEVELAEHREKLKILNDVETPLLDEQMRLYRQKLDLRGDPKLEKELTTKVNEKQKLLDKIHDEKLEVANKIFEIQSKHRAKQHEIFYVAPENRISINLTLPIFSKLKKERETTLQPQADFAEKLWVPQSGNKIIDIKVLAKGGGGGHSKPTQKTIKIGTDYIGTTPLHEYVHQIEEQTPGAEVKRKWGAIKIILNRTGKKSIEEVEVEPWTYTDSSGKKHTKRDTLNKQDIYIPKGVFKTEEEKRDWGYMFRIYKHDTELKGKERIIKPRQGFSYIGIEMPTVAAERIYTNPAKFAKEQPDVFDMVVDLYRGKLT